MGPRSRSRSVTPRGSYSHSPNRRSGRRRSYSRHRYDYHSISKSRHPPSPPLPPGSHSRDDSRRSFSRSVSPRCHRRYFGNVRHNSKTRSRSQSRSRSRSRTPYDRNNRNNREKRSPTRCLGVFGLSVNTTQQKVREIFSKYGAIDRIHVVIDAQTGRSRGFCFIYYRHLADAEVAREHCCGLEIDGRRIRVAYSITERPHTPTPGTYKGRPTKELRRHRSPSPYRNRGHRQRYERSRSRSHSPRRHRY